MNKVPLLTGLLCAGIWLPFQANAQTVRLGFKGGANLSNVSGNLANEDLYKNKLGFHVGAVLNLGLLGDFLSLQPEALYSQKGFSYADKDVSINGATWHYQGSRSFQYLDVPVLLKLKAGPLYVEAGPQYGYLLGLKDESTISQNGQPSAGASTSQSVKDMNRHEIGYAVGLGLQGASGLSIGLRYTGAFTDFAKNGAQNDDLRDARNSVFLASIGFLLPRR